MDNNNQRGTKLTVGILTIVEGIGAIFSGIFLLVFLIAFKDIFKEMLEMIESEMVLYDDSWTLGFLTDFMQTIFIVGGVISLVVGLVYLFLGIKFCSGKPDKGIAITIIVFAFMSLSIISIIKIVFLFMYLGKLGNQQTSQNVAFVSQPASPQNVGSVVNQPAQAVGVYCGSCGSRYNPGDKFCKVCGRQL